MPQFVGYSSMIKSLRTGSRLLKEAAQHGDPDWIIQALRDLKVSGNKDTTDAVLGNPGAFFIGASLEQEVWLKYELALLLTLNNRIQEANCFASVGIGQFPIIG
jgi:hypothetical protein